MQAGGDKEENLSDTIRLLLRVSQERVNEGKGEDALAAVLHAIRLTRGEEGILEVLDEAKRRADARYNSEVERQTVVARGMVNDLLQQETLLSEVGDEDLLRQAFEDGSSVVCRRCQALVPAARWEQHRDVWCSAIPEEEDESADDEV